MIKKLGIIFAGSVILAILIQYLRSIRMLKYLPAEKRVALDGIITLAQAVEACRNSNLKGWELVAYAQNLAARKMRYSRLNSWDSPSTAFERGMGYCMQSMLALYQIYQALGIEAKPVHALKCKFPAGEIDGYMEPAAISSHTWLRVKIGEEEKDVCPGSVENKPGLNHFEILSPVLSFGKAMQIVTYFGAVLINVRRYYKQTAKFNSARFAKQPPDHVTRKQRQLEKS
jgi:hypothetical protein